MDNEPREKDIDERITEFERQNPKVVEAMKLFGISLSDYECSINSMLPPRLLGSNSTTTTVRRLND